MAIIINWYLFTCNVYAISGAIFDRNVRLNAEILNHSVEIANSQILMDSDIQLKAQVETIEYGNEFAAAETVCELLKVCVWYGNTICIHR